MRRVTSVRRARRAGPLGRTARRAPRLVERPLLELMPAARRARARRRLVGAATTVAASPTHGSRPRSGCTRARGTRPRGRRTSRPFPATGATSATCSTVVASSAFDEAFVIGGDAKDRGDLHDGLSLLRAMDGLLHPFATVGVAGYPEGHPASPTTGCRGPARQAGLRDPRHDADDVRRRRDAPGSGGLAPPAFACRSTSARRAPIRSGGSSGSPRVGVGGSLRYLRKNRQVLQLLVPRTYTAVGCCGPSARRSPIRRPTSTRSIFTFNQVVETVDWQRRLLEELDD